MMVPIMITFYLMNSKIGEHPMTRLQKIVALWIDLGDEEREEFLKIAKENPHGRVNFQRALKLSKLTSTQLFTVLREGQVEGRTPIDGVDASYREHIKAGRLKQGGEYQWQISYPSLAAYVASQGIKEE
jgi:hypothetical protein